jgi:peptide-methionine (R)-S-oxide reductase
MLTRRFLLTGAATGLAGVAAGHAFAAGFRVNYSEADWRKRLTPDQFAVLRKEATERPFSSPLNNEHRKGVFSCAGCATPVYSSTTKFESGTGWPSFWEPLKGGVGTKLDRSLGAMRTAVYCATCGGHLGHMFPDGPKPTGLRYCMNGVAMTFKAA